MKGRCVGVPREIKPLEGRVALTPPVAAELVRAGHRVCLEQGAGEISGYEDAAYAAVGVEILPDADSLYASAEVVVKVKEPVGPELDRLRAEQILFSYLHLAPNPALTRRLCEIGLTAIAFETVMVDGDLPLLRPMSEIAGRIAVQVGTHLLHTPQGGRGVLLGGVPGVEHGQVAVLGAGHAGGSAARLAAALGAQVTVFDRDPRKLAAMAASAPNIQALYASAEAIDRAVCTADLLVGAVLLPGAEAPRLVSRQQVAAMRDGSVIADIAVDQGGCIETTRPATYDDPVYVEEGVLHFCVTNMPGAVPRSASQALAGALLPWLQRLLQPDWVDDPVLAGAINVAEGEIVLSVLRGEE
ncbi:alanine dehydrogenase [endosymbiont of unidentified scaly snail isolate Monju]|uniref:alanine dehydrogenase n=1 Tax=endosymbiont of unidentified scaly snail isolate Monju TaxID=1248727 RepID=UPI0005BD5687|nr:alanine dehydrogenase [endosymbiont of unidentified scaly snail isolate Monju]